MTSPSSNRLRNLPAVQTVLTSAAIQACRNQFPLARVTEAVRRVIAAKRRQLLTETGQPELSLEAIAAEVEARLRQEDRPRLKRVINATGVVLHTNLGRAPLAQSALDHAVHVARGYCNLEFDLDTGQRGERYVHVEPLICRLTGAEAALVVNNNAAAVLLILCALARGRDVIASRGQLIEIGGSFRLPEVIAQSGARLVEVGTTNKTRPSDYEAAISGDTALLLRTHPSNFRMVGFTGAVSPRELAELGRAHGIPTVEDQGSGVLIDLPRYGLPSEPGVADSLKAGIDLVSCSGDKLLGGPQAGIIAGRQALIQELKRHPLLRALRVDKLTLAALETTLHVYLDEPRATEELPVLNMLTRSPADLATAAGQLAARLHQRLGGWAHVAVQPGESEAGGGSLPDRGLPTTLVALQPHTVDLPTLVGRLREGVVPVIARVGDNALLLDPRTLLPAEAEELVDILVDALTE